MDLASTPSPEPPFVAAAPGELELVEAVRRRDRKATADFVARFSDAVYSYVFWRLSPAVDAAEDIVQEVFIAAWKGLPTYQGDGGLHAWLLGIARHKVQDHYRKALRHSPVPEDDAPEPVEPPWLEESIFAREREQRVREAMDALPEIYRLVLLWRYWDGQSAAEMARASGRTEKAVERLLARARVQFRAHYEDKA